ncbi:MAG: carboxypeptidase regulatory-like domain-containing protein [Pseudomonadales bacterium]|nr:carboxypeptidase regulatory-like domain-containing protein [Pseudomonadales bacterium]
MPLPRLFHRSLPTPIRETGRRRASSCQVWAVHTLCGAVALSAPLSLAGGGVSGRVADSTESVYFEGAEIEIVELRRQTTSKKDGSFEFTDVPAGEYSIKVDYLGAKTLTATVTVKHDQRAVIDFEIGGEEALIEAP